MGERTGSRVLQWVWSYVKVTCTKIIHILCNLVNVAMHHVVVSYGGLNEAFEDLVIADLLIGLPDPFISRTK